MVSCWSGSRASPDFIRGFWVTQRMKCCFRKDAVNGGGGFRLYFYKLYCWLLQPEINCVCSFPFLSLWYLSQSCGENANFVGATLWSSRSWSLPSHFCCLLVCLEVFWFREKKSNSHTVEMEETIKCKFNMNKNKDLGNEFVWNFEQEVPSPV